MITTRNKPIKTAFTAIMIFLCTITLANAHTSGKEGGSRNNGSETWSKAGSGYGAGPERGDNLKEILELSTEQVEQIQPIRNESRQEMQEARKALRDARREFQAIAEKAADETALREAFKPLAAAYEDMEILRFKSIMKIKAILTPEQLDTFQSMKQNRFRQRGGQDNHRDMRGRMQPQQGRDQSQE